MTNPHNLSLFLWKCCPCNECKIWYTINIGQIFIDSQITQCLNNKWMMKRIARFSSIDTGICTNMKIRKWIHIQLHFECNICGWVGRCADSWSTVYMLQLLQSYQKYFLGYIKNCEAHNFWSTRTQSHKQNLSIPTQSAISKFVKIVRLSCYQSQKQYVHSKQHVHTFDFMHDDCNWQP